jgi:hypothetical protein
MAITGHHHTARAKTGPIYGIPCSLGSQELRRTICSVLQQIRQRSPRDFARIRTLVREFAALPESEGGTLGQWNRDTRFDLDSPGVVELSADTAHLVALIAHELGHVCTREEDFLARDNGVHGEWSSEMCADYYAYRWGFGREIARHRKSRDWSHHGPAPGATFTISGDQDGIWHCYRVTRRFYLRFLQTETVDGKLIETAKQITDRKIAEWAKAHGIPPRLSMKRKQWRKGGMTMAVDGHEDGAKVS